MATDKAIELAYKAIMDAQLHIQIAQLGITKALEILGAPTPLEMPVSDDRKKSTRMILHEPKPDPVPEPKDELVINEEWQSVLNQLNNGHSSMFITGPAGSGKTTLEQHFIENYGGNVAVVAPTGVAALRAGGMTIHRFFGFGAHALDDDDIPTLDDSRRSKYRALDKLVIDEISMVRGDMMDAIDKFMRKNGRDKTKPFGGCQLVMVGDLYQLPPVSKEKDEKRWLLEKYGTEQPYFFHAGVWRDTPLKTTELSTIFRQKDPAFTNALNEIRSGIMSPDTMRLINTRVNRSFVPPMDKLWLTLTTTNDVADRANRQMLVDIKSPGKIFVGIATPEFDMKNAPTDLQLELKVGATVMFIRNSADKFWVNGTLGKVVSLNPLEVEIDGEEYEVAPETWEQIEYNLDPKTKKLAKRIKGTFTQIPLKLAAAITIHKSQGLSLDQVIIDLSWGSFAAGQAYVGLSRCRSLEGMVLRRPLQNKDLITSSEVQAFLSGQPIARPNGQMSLLESGA